MKTFCNKYSNELTMVYSKLSFYNSHSAAGVWFTFWYDVWINNRHLVSYCRIYESILFKKILYI